MKDVNKHYNHVAKIFFKTREWSTLRSRVIDAIGTRCMRCNYPFSTQIDHVFPRWHDKNGTLWLDPDNLQVLCDECNENKNIETHNSDWRTDEDKAALTKLRENLESEGVKFSWDTLAHTPETKSKNQSEYEKWLATL